MTDTLDLAALGFAGVSDLESLARVLTADSVMQSAGTCSNPIRLIGGRDVIERATGRLLDSTHDQRATVCCGNRRATRCAYCSTLYKYDAYNLVAAGLRGGGHGNLPTTVATHPVLFVTLTAPSFGPVHLGPDKQGNTRPCRPRRDNTGCPRWHRAGDPLIGTPIDPKTYDYVGHVLFNALASKLWSVTTTEIRRTLARRAGLTRKAFSEQAAVTFAKVAEYQARGTIHFHAVLRLDGPDGAASSPPAWATTDLLADAVREGVARVRVAAPESRAVGSPVFAWGRQLDVRPITSGLDAVSGLTDVTVARYIAKYATKAAEAAGVELRPLTCRACDGTGHLGETSLPCQDCDGTARAYDLDQWHLTDHARTLIETCWRLGEIPEYTPLRLRQWAHMLGFRGHFATKSRTYSTTFGALRQERSDYKRRLDPLLTALDESTDIIVVNHWAYAGPADQHATPRHAPSSARPSGDGEAST